MGLVAKNIVAVAAGVTLLDGVDVDVPAGQVTAVLGPNGAGKTSLLRVLCGELSPQQGSVTLNGRPLAACPVAERARHLAVLPQQSALNFPFTAAEVVMLGRTPHATGQDIDRQVVAQALATVDLESLAQRVYTRLSGGEKQRVHLARVLAQIACADTRGQSASAPRFLLLDEPTAAFDLAHQAMTLNIIAQLAEQGIGVFIVLHDLNLAARCADSVVLLRDGAIAAAGAPADVLNAAVIEQVFDVRVRVDRHPVHGTPLVYQ